MVNTKLYIPITIISLLLLAYSSFILLSTNSTSTPTTFSLEFDTVIHNQYNRSLGLSDFERIKTTFTEPISTRFLLLFISGSDECSNSMNEISDYISLANLSDPLKGDFTSFLLFHGVDEHQASRFIRVTGISDIINGLAFIETARLPEFDFGSLIPQYGSQNLLYLFDLEANVMFHGFVLPAGNTTKWDVKEIAFNDAILTYTQNNNQQR
jgi:hypothetical protein